MNATIQMDSSGRLVLPKAVRERLNLQGGASLRVTVVAGRLELTPVEDADAPKLIKKAGMTVIARSGRKLNVAAAVAAERESQAERGRHQQ